MPYVQLIDGQWAPAQWPYRFSDGRLADSLSILAEEPGALEAAGYFASRQDVPEGYDVLVWDGGTLEDGMVVYRPVEKNLRITDLTFDQFARMATASGFAAKAAALAAANPGVFEAWLMVNSFGYLGALQRLAEAGAANVPTIEEIHAAAEAFASTGDVEKVADEPSPDPTSEPAEEPAPEPAMEDPAPEQSDADPALATVKKALD